jgi:hypothetical protein
MTCSLPDTGLETRMQSDRGLKGTGPAAKGMIFSADEKSGFKPRTADAPSAPPSCHKAIDCQLR